MSQGEKAAFYKALKAAGVTFDKHYREYSTAELKQAYDRLAEQGAVGELPAPEPAPAAPQQPVFDAAATAAALREAAMVDHPSAAPRPVAPVAKANPNEMPGQRLNQQPEDEPIRVDENGLIWYQEEVRKSATPKPRGRRVLKYMESGVRQETIKTGEYVETFEVAGDLPSRPAEVKITLPSYQVGIYKDPRFPFKIHVYNETRGFDLFEVEAFYGGRELVPTDVKRIYVENVLCYDIRTTVRAIQTEYRQLQLQGKA